MCNILFFILLHQWSSKAKRHVPFYIGNKFKYSALFLLQRIKLLVRVSKLWPKKHLGYSFTNICNPYLNIIHQITTFFKSNTVRYVTYT